MADLVPRDRRQRDRHASRRSSLASPESRCHEAVSIRRADAARVSRRRRGATMPASSKTSATPRCSCPTTSATSSRRCPRWRWRPRTPRRCASARWCTTTTTSIPAILAKEAATIDLLSDGRLEFGIGAGWMRVDYDMLGLPYDPPAVRVDRFEEALHIVQAVLHRREVHVSRRALPHHRLHVVPEAGAAGRSAALDRRRRQARALDRGPSGRHRRHQSQLEVGRARPRVGRSTR